MTATAYPTVVVGASVAGVRVVQALRARGDDRPIVLLDRETGAPYDKPALSKSALTEPEPTPQTLLSSSEARDLDVEFHGGTTVSAVDLAARRVICLDGAEVPFGHLVVATGSHPRPLGVLDAFDGVHYLRTWSDASALRRRLRDRPTVVVVGGGFIGAEVASSARTLGLDVTLIEAGPQLFGRVMPAEIGRYAADLHRSNGVHVICDRVVVRGRGKTRIEEIELDDGTRLPADLVVVGIGTVATTDWLRHSGLPLSDGLGCNANLAVHGADQVWAVGDVARWEDAEVGTSRRTEHWTTAREQAVYVAEAITGGLPSRPFTTTGYVWSDQHGVRIQHVGNCDGATTTRRQPADDGHGELFLHSRGCTVVGATAFNAPRSLLAVRRSLTRPTATSQNGAHR
jgi:NADPH-dependent 2,4-dienoyl-CoA reductase/sulfur reductase-like enzyme